MPSGNSITIVVPARDEEQRLEAAVGVMTEAARQWFDEYEILIFNDASTDRTGEVADRLAAEDSCIRAIHHRDPASLGGVIAEGYALAKMAHVTWLAGKGSTSRDALDRIFSAAGQADLVIPYHLNEGARPWQRRVPSRLFQGLLNLLFGLNIRYYNDSVLCSRPVAQSVNVRTRGYAYQAEALVKMLKAGHSYEEVGFEDVFKIDERNSRAMKIGNLLSVASAIAGMLWDVYGPGRRRANRDGIANGAVK